MTSPDPSQSFPALRDELRRVRGRRRGPLRIAAAMATDASRLFECLLDEQEDNSVVGGDPGSGMSFREEMAGMLLSLLELSDRMDVDLGAEATKLLAQRATLPKESEQSGVSAEEAARIAEAIVRARRLGVGVSEVRDFGRGPGMRLSFLTSDPQGTHCWAAYVDTRPEGSMGFTLQSSTIVLIDAETGACVWYGSANDEG